MIFRKIKKESYEKNIGIENNSYYIEIETIIENLLSQFKSGIINNFEVLSKKGDIIYEGYNLYKKLPIIYNLINKFNDHKITINIYFYYLITLAEKFMGIEYYIYLIETGKKFDMIELDFIKNFNEVKKYFQFSEIQFNQYFFFDLKRKIDNMFHYAILNISKKEYNNCFPFSTKKKVTPKDIVKHYFSKNINLKSLYPHILVESDGRYIFKSLKSNWFKCLKGHIYTSDEIKNIKDAKACPHCSFSDKAFIWMKNSISKVI